MASGYLYPGRVVKLDPAGPIVVVPLLGGDALWGPVDSSVPDLAIGERVICGTMGSSANDLRIIGRVPGRAPTVEEIPGLSETLDAHTMRLEAVELNNATDQLVLEDHSTRLATAESSNTAQDVRLTATEGVASGAATSASAASTAVATLRTDTAGRATTKGDLLIATASGVLARQPVVPTGWMLSGDPASPTGWASRDVLGLPRSLAGATTPTRYVGGTAAGAPTTGTFAVGDFVVSADGEVWVCTVGGTPGTWLSRTRSAGRGFVAKGRRDTNPAAVAATGGVGGNWIRVCELTAAVLPGRSYEIGSLNLGVYTDQATEVRASLFYTVNNTAPTTTSANMQWAQIESPAGGRVKTLPVIGCYEPSTAQTLRVLLAVTVTITVGGTLGVFCNPDWPMDAWIRDAGPAGVGGYVNL